MRRMSLPLVVAALAGSLPLHGLRHGAPEAALPSVAWKDDTKIALQWPAPLDTKPELFDPDSGNPDTPTGPADHYVVCVTSTPPPMPGPWPEYWPWEGDMMTWADAIPPIGNPPTPSQPGVLDSVIMGGLSPSTTYYVFVITYDEQNQSAWSPLLQVATDPLDTTAPSTPVLTVAPAGIGLGISWAMPGDDGLAGGAPGSFEVRMLPGTPVTAATWGGATLVGSDEMLGMVGPGELQSFAVPGLAGGVIWCFGIKVDDTSGNSSAIGMGQGSIPAGDGDAEEKSDGGGCAGRSAGGGVLIAGLAVLLIRR